MNRQLDVVEPAIVTEEDVVEAESADEDEGEEVMALDIVVSSLLSATR